MSHKKPLFHPDDGESPPIASGVDEDIDVNSLPHSNRFPSQAKVVMRSLSQEGTDHWQRTLQYHNEHESLMEQIDRAASAVLKGSGFLEKESNAPGFSLISSSEPVTRPSSRKSQQVINDKEEVRPRTAPSLEFKSDSLDTLLEDLLQNPDNHRSLDDLVASTENPIDLWRKGVDGKQNRVNVRRNIAFQTFQRTSGEPPKTPPQVPSQELSSTQVSQSEKGGRSKIHKFRAEIPSNNLHRHKSFRKFFGKVSIADTDDMFELSSSPSASAPRRQNLHPQNGPNYSRVHPKVDTGLGQMHTRKEAKIGHDGVPLPVSRHQNQHPLTLGSRLTTKAFDYGNARARRQLMIAEVTDRLHHNSGSRIKDYRSYFGPTSTQQISRKGQSQGQEGGQHGGIGGRLGQSHRAYPGLRDIENLTKQRHPFSNSLSMNAMRNKLYPGRGGGRPLDLDRLSLFNPVLSNSRYDQNMIRANYNITAALSYGGRGQGYGQSKFSWNTSGRPQAPFQPPQGQNNGQKKIFRPSQLLPIHIPGPKHDNIYIGPYSEVKPVAEVGVPIKSRKR